MGEAYCELTRMVSLTINIQATPNLISLFGFCQEFIKYLNLLDRTLSKRSDLFMLLFQSIVLSSDFSFVLITERSVDGELPAPSVT